MTSRMMIPKTTKSVLRGFIRPIDYRLMSFYNGNTVGEGKKRTEIRDVIGETSCNSARPFGECGSPPVKRYVASPHNAIMYPVNGKCQFGECFQTNMNDVVDSNK